MKKILIILMFITFILGINHPVLKEYENKDEIHSDELQENVSDKLNGTIKITAVGDCTLATDVNYGGSGSFVSEVSNQKNDYTYFLKNVKDIFENDDLTIVNFEGTLSTNGSRAEKLFAFGATLNM